MYRSMTWWIRVFLITSIIRGLFLGFKGLVDAPEIPIPLQLTPLNAAFVAALYLAGTLGLILTLFARDMVTTPVPEPETYGMLLAGLGVLGLVARRRKLG